MKILKKSSLLFILMLGISGIYLPSASAGGGSVEDEVIASIEKRYKNIKGLQADFNQQNYIASLDQFRQFQGKLFLLRPHLFAMEVSSPSNQTLVFDGQFFWIYTSANNQALKHPVAPDFSDHPLINLLTSMADLRKNFFFSLAKPDSAPDYLLNLTLKDPKTDIQKIHLAVTRKEFQIKEITLYYASGNYTRLALKEIRENPDISPERFQFTPPPGTEIVENLTPLMQP
ncbi:MAG: outer membrane lipoprotein carrier protein LolA [Proteobacteria bacterium]|nr:outer membrane lipoprotein carrier protein LolA [Pseudomonadota bacterium]